MCGYAAGIIFILVTKKVLDQFNDLHIGNLQRVDAEKMIMIVFVMTLHSITEGIGIGVSFGGKSGVQLGQFISLSLAVHNVPEGLAVALVMTEKKVSILRTGEITTFRSLTLLTKYF
jgi:zinc transporter, ZIP family